MFGYLEAAQIDKAIIRGYESETAGRVARNGHQIIGCRLGSVEIRDHFGEIQVKAGIGLGYMVQL